MKVFKYPLKVPLGDQFGPQILNLSAGASIVHVGEQHGQLCLWAALDPDRMPIARRFVVAGTGHAVGNGLIHRGTAVCAGGALVWHVFELPGEGS